MALQDTIGRHWSRIYAMMWWHHVILILVADVQDGVFKGDESRHYIGWYEVSCSLLLISLLAWVPERLNARLPLTLLMTSWFVLHFLWVSASTVDPFCDTRLISLCSIVEVVVWLRYAAIAYIYSSLQNVSRHIPEGIQQICNTGCCP
jgi:hypothetical protein